MNVNFTDIVKSEEQLRQILGFPGERVIRKVIPRLDEHCREFIANSPFLLIGSADENGHMDVSPKGDPAGFVHVLDETTLAIPDRPGNRRADTFTNLLQNPNIGLIFLIPGKQETLRVNGTALIVRDERLRKGMAVNGRVPEFAIVVHVEEAFFHCAKCMIRSNLWSQEGGPAADDTRSLAEAMVDAGQLDDSVDEMQEIIDESYSERLY